MRPRARALTSNLAAATELIELADEQGDTSEALFVLKRAASLIAHANLLIKQHITLATIAAPPGASSRVSKFWYQIVPDPKLTTYWSKLGMASHHAKVLARLKVSSLEELSKMNKISLLRTKYVGPNLVRKAHSLLAHHHLDFTGTSEAAIEVSPPPEFEAPEEPG